MVVTIVTLHRFFLASKPLHVHTSELELFPESVDQSASHGNASCVPRWGTLGGQSLHL